MAALFGLSLRHPHFDPMAFRRVCLNLRPNFKVLGVVLRIKLMFEVPLVFNKLLNLLILKPNDVFQVLLISESFLKQVLVVVLLLF